MKVVDHVIPVEQAPGLALDYNNTQSLCNFCHNIKTMADARAKKEQDRLKRGKKLMKELETQATPGGEGKK